MRRFGRLEIRKLKRSGFSKTLLVSLLCSCTSSRAETGDQPSHYAKDGFQNPLLDRDSKGLFDFLKARLSGEWPAVDTSKPELIPQNELTREQLIAPGDQPKVTWMGHSTLLVQVDGKSILTDPIFSERASPVGFAGPKRYTSPAVKIEDLPAIDLVVISHNHYDHLDEATVLAIGNQTHWCVPLGLKTWFNDLGVTEVTEFDWWTKKIINGIEVQAAPSQHWSSRGMFDHYDTLWASWRVQVGGFNAWFAGDTGYNPVQFKEIGERLGPFDLAMIPIGAYKPRWFMKEMHANPADAVEIQNPSRL